MRLNKTEAICLELESTTIEVLLMWLQILNSLFLFVKFIKGFEQYQPRKADVLHNKFRIITAWVIVKFFKDLDYGLGCR